MAPLVVLIGTTVVLWVLGTVGVARFRSLRDVIAWAMAAMFLLTASAHFTYMRQDLAAMIPPPLTGNMALIYFTGVLEVVGAIGLLLPRFRRTAALCLIVLLAALLPANIYAATHHVTFRGEPPTPLLPRILLQIIWAGLLWWSSVRRRNADEPALLASRSPE